MITAEIFLQILVMGLFVAVASFALWSIWPWNWSPQAWLSAHKRKRQAAKLLRPNKKGLGGKVKGWWIFKHIA